MLCFTRELKYCIALFKMFEKEVLKLDDNFHMIFNVMKDGPALCVDCDQLLDVSLLSSFLLFLPSNFQNRLPSTRLAPFHSRRFGS